MAERRNKQQILYDIVYLIRRKNNKVKPTHILYGGNLSYNRMKVYLDELEAKGLIEQFEDKHRKFYRLTQKGFEFISQIEKIKQVEEAFGI